ncbi:ATP phosphoribosyltransferase [Kaistia dalseonensis]|uniref:ATP phosphoribosyltransferase n=1 Tax=Kaistia dalseonensis TaxID=410840 RepID=A0ABU0H6U4_9HYPH|nr:ATP phosphoribosyltransferase [Kaistia dalseonensis]MCX5495447.1 ATP phosphoribosyltransferase [Kaistia dalseonensis]MDQ0438036.1 ATP phosphoribosyltransferase [Kaistia dalseonensis]
MTSAPLVLAVPSKGRLQENANAFFARAGLSVLQSGGERTYRGKIAGLGDVEIAYLSASEITRELAAGSVHLGVTGRDLVEEEVPDFNERLDLVLPLGFGHADVVVAVPEAWIDVRTMADLDDVAADFRARHGRWLTVATKYVNLTRRFFDTNGIADYRIIESLGATEGAPASGAADLIVDITSTGSTLTANALKVVNDGVILRSEAHLVASFAASWSGAARSALRTILDRIEAEAAGRSLREIRADVVDTEGAARVALDRFGATAPFGTSGGPLTLHCQASKVYACAEWLRTGAGARTVSVTRIETIFSSTSPLAERLLGRLDGHIAG